MEGITIPAKWNTWKVIELIGEGACSEVYHVRDRISGRDAALKVITIEKTALSQEGFIVDVGLEAMVQSMAPMDDKFFRKKIEKTENEIELLQSLKGHENIVTLYDYEIVVEEDVATVYILMEYLQDLWAWFDIHTLSEDAVIELGVQICKALEYCEGKSIFHQDIKPENILVSRDGSYKLTDFSVSGVQKDGMDFSVPQGTLIYMAPESIVGKGYTKQSEVYALGLVLYQLANEKCLPFMDRNKGIFIEQDFRNSIEGRCKGLDIEKPSEVSDELAAVIVKACAFDAKERYASVIEFREALEEVKNKARASEKVRDRVKMSGEALEPERDKAAEESLESEKDKAEDTEADCANDKEKGRKKARARKKDKKKGQNKDQEKEQTKAQKKDQKSFGKIPVMIAGGVVAAAIIIGIFIFISGGKKDPQVDNARVTQMEQPATAMEKEKDSAVGEENVTSESAFNSEDDQKAPKSSRSFEKKDFYQVGDYIYDKDIKLTYVSSGIYESSNEYVQPEEGNKFIFLELLLENLSETEIHHSDFVDYSCYADGEYCQKVEAGTVDECVLTPGRDFLAHLVYEVPESAEYTQVRYSLDHDNSIEDICFRYEGENKANIVPEENRIQTDEAILRGDVTHVGDLAITVSNVNSNALVDGNDELRQGYHRVAVTYHVENTGSEEYSLSHQYFPLFADGYYCQCDIYHSDLSLTVSPATAVDMVLTYEVPDSSNCMEIDYFEEEGLFSEIYKCTFSLNEENTK